MATVTVGADRVYGAGDGAVGSGDARLAMVMLCTLLNDSGDGGGGDDGGACDSVASSTLNPR